MLLLLLLLLLLRLLQRMVQSLSLMRVLGAAVSHYHTFQERWVPSSHRCRCLLSQLIDEYTHIPTLIVSMYYDNDFHEPPTTRQSQAMGGGDGGLLLQNT